MPTNTSTPAPAGPPTIQEQIAIAQAMLAEVQAIRAEIVRQNEELKLIIAQVDAYIQRRNRPV